MKTFHVKRTVWVIGMYVIIAEVYTAPDMDTLALHLSLSKNFDEVATTTIIEIDGLSSEGHEAEGIIRLDVARGSITKHYDSEGKFIDSDRSLQAVIAEHRAKMIQKDAERKAK